MVHVYKNTTVNISLPVLSHRNLNDDMKQNNSRDVESLASVLPDLKLFEGQHVRTRAVSKFSFLSATGLVALLRFGTSKRTRDVIQQRYMYYSTPA